MSDFAWAFPCVEALNPFIHALPEAVTQELGPGGLDSSVEIARLRRALDNCHKLVQRGDAQVPTPNTTQLPTPIMPSQPSQWMEHLPPRLTQDIVQDMVDKFKANYPGELLDQDSMPSIRLLSLVHHSLKPGEKIRWIPWQFRLSARQYQEHMEAKTAKPLRTEAQIIASAFFDETPEVPVEHMRLAAAWLDRIQTVFRNAWALCGAAHLHNLKALDKKVKELCLRQPDAQLGLRTPTTAELISADRKIWASLSELVAQSWSLDDALHEITSIRNDLSSLLQLRPKMQPDKGQPKGQGKNADSPNKRKSPNTPPRLPRWIREQRDRLRRGRGKGRLQIFRPTGLPCTRDSPFAAAIKTANANSRSASSPTCVQFEGVPKSTPPMSTASPGPETVRASHPQWRARTVPDNWDHHSPCRTRSSRPRRKPRPFGLPAPSCLRPRTNRLPSLQPTCP